MRTHCEVATPLSVASSGDAATFAAKTSTREKSRLARAKDSRRRLRIRFLFAERFPLPEASPYARGEDARHDRLIPGPRFSNVTGNYKRTDATVAVLTRPFASAGRRERADRDPHRRILPDSGAHNRAAARSGGATTSVPSSMHPRAQLSIASQGHWHSSGRLEAGQGLGTRATCETSTAPPTHLASPSGQSDPFIIVIGVANFSGEPRSRIQRASHPRSHPFSQPDRTRGSKKRRRSLAARLVRWCAILRASTDDAPLVRKGRSRGEDERTRGNRPGGRRA